MEAKWREWGEWTPCSATCGGGTRRRQRGFSEGRNGAAFKPMGIESEEMTCGEGACPLGGVENGKNENLSMG